MLKKTPLLLFLLIVLICSSQCKKNKPNTQYTITGKLLESITNPIPVKSYSFNLYQKERSGFTGWSPGLTKDFTTDADGIFSITYSLEKGTGIYALGYNQEPLKITGIDSILYRGVFVQYYPIPVNKDTSLNLVYIK